MFVFVEEFIEKKIKIAEYLYIKKGQLDFNTFNDEFEISYSTFQRYVKEIDQEYQEYYVNGNLYNTYALKHITRDLLDQSDRLALFKAIAFYPGHDSSYYRDYLRLSSSKFARLLAQIKINLIQFNMTIDVSSGYWIKGKNEYEVILLFSYITTLYRTNKEEVYKLLSPTLVSYYDHVSQNEVLFKHPFEAELIRTIYLFTLLRSYQVHQHEDTSKNYLNELISFLKQTFEKIKEQHYEHCKMVIDTFYSETIEENKREELIRLIYKVAFYVELFPYEFSMLSRRQEFMVEKMYETSPTRKVCLESFISRLQQLTKIPLHKRKHSLIYFIMELDILVFEEYKPFYLGIYSNLGEQHLDFLVNQVGFLSSYFENSFTVVPLLNEEEHLQYKKNMIILTNSAIESCASDRQYLISDFLALEEFGEFSIWLHKKTSFYRKY